MPTISIGKKTYSNKRVSEVLGHKLKPTVIYKVKVDSKTVEVFLSKVKAERYADRLRRK
jgi:hypothetical protein